MQQRPQTAVTGQIMRGIYRIVVLPEKLGALLLGQIPQDGLRIIRLLGIDRLGDHGVSLRPDTDRTGGEMQHDEEQWVPEPGSARTRHDAKRR
jgi:hypothetical protein